MGVKLHTFLTSEMEEGDWLALCLSSMALWDTASDTHRIGGWMGLNTLSVHFEEQKSLFLAGIKHRLFSQHFYLA
jgi:hypothetical protein